ncbi:MAG: pilus assembly protein PilP [Desulfobacterales bacterium]|nr:pilus assembly protein PilP [Desulfobacterales bacterium]
MHNYIIKILATTCITCLFLYYGCNDQAAKQQKATVISKKIVMPKKAKQPIKQDQKIEPSKPEINTVPDQKIELSDTSDSYSYKVEGKIDPFASIFRDGVSVFADQNDGKKKSLIPLTPIEKVDLSQLKLVGIISAPSGNKALVEDASGKGFVIKKDTRIGINSGRVVEILKNLVVVEEEAENILGKTILVKRELKLQKPPGEE